MPMPMGVPPQMGVPPPMGMPPPPMGMPPPPMGMPPPPMGKPPAAPPMGVPPMGKPPAAPPASYGDTGGDATDVAPVVIKVGVKLGSGAKKVDTSNLVFYDEDECMEEKRATLARYRVMEEEVRT